jgi:hypothetical protein
LFTNTQNHKKLSCHKKTTELKYIWLLFRCLKLLLEHIFEKNCSIEFINPVRPSIRLSVRPSVRPYVPYFFAIFQPTIFKFWILREDYLSTRSTAGFFDPKPRSSGIELRLGPSQIKVFSLYFINFSETINVFQLISQGCSKIQIFQKKFFLGSIGSSW